MTPDIPLSVLKTLKGFIEKHCMGPGQGQGRGQGPGNDGFHTINCV